MSIRGTDRKAGTGGGEAVGERDAASETVAQPGASYRIKKGDTAATLVARLYPSTDEHATPRMLGLALDFWLRDHGHLGARAGIETSAGKTITLPDSGEFWVYYQNHKQLGRSDRLSSTGQKENAARQLAKSKGPKGLELVAIPKGNAGAMRMKFGRRAGAGAEAPEPKLEKIGAEVDLRLAAPQQMPKALAKVCERAGVPAEARAAVVAFCVEQGLSLEKLVPALASGTYQGGEAGEALKAYAVALHAVEARLVDGERRGDLREHFLGAITRGDLRFDLTTLAADAQARGLPVGAHAQYRHADATTGDAAFDAAHPGDAIYLPPGGVDLRSVGARAVLVHEAQHVVQDSRRDTNTGYGFERDGHEAAAQYVLRASGVLREDEHGALVADVERFNAVLADPSGEGILRSGGWERVETYVMASEFARALDDIDPGVHGDLAGHGAVSLADARAVARALLEDGAGRSRALSFEDVYRASQLSMAGRETRAIQSLGERYTKQGIRSR